MTISTPTKITVPFATSGSKNTIPVPSQISILAGAASYTDGFPPLTMTPKTAGGVAPYGQDMNGILYAITQALQYSQAGGLFTYDSTFATNVGGYPQGAIVISTDYSGVWLNTVANNTTAPESFGAGWVPYYQYGGTSITMTSSNVTLSALQAAKPIIFITGTLTSSLNLIFPAWVRDWKIINNTIGGFFITAKTAAGSGTVLASGANSVYGDGTNIASMTTATGVLPGQIIAFSGSTAPAGYLQCPTASTAVSRTTYASLFSAIGTTWGTGDGSTTFGIPYFPTGYGMIAGSPGSTSVGAVIAHTHSYNEIRGGGALSIAGGTSNLGIFASTTGSTGGAANYGAGSNVIMCVKY